MRLCEEGPLACLSARVMNNNNVPCIRQKIEGDAHPPT